jgi:WD40 repeat protein
VSLRLRPDRRRDPCQCLTYGPDGRRLAAGYRSGRVVIWEFGADGARPALRLAAPQPVHDLAFSPDGRRLAAATRGQTHLWDTASGLEMIVLRGNPRPAGDLDCNPAVRFSPEGDRLLVGNGDGTVSLYDAAPLTPATRAARIRAARERGRAGHGPTPPAAGRAEAGRSPPSAISP